MQTQNKTSLKLELLTSTFSSHKNVNFKPNFRGHFPLEKSNGEEQFSMHNCALVMPSKNWHVFSYKKKPFLNFVLKNSQNIIERAENMKGLPTIAPPTERKIAPDTSYQEYEAINGTKWFRPISCLGLLYFAFKTVLYYQQMRYIRVLNHSFLGKMKSCVGILNMSTAHFKSSQRFRSARLAYFLPPVQWNEWVLVVQRDHRNPKVAGVRTRRLPI